jgi:hypothetical protein
MTGINCKKPLDSEIKVVYINERRQGTTFTLG